MSNEFLPISMPMVAIGSYRGMSCRTPAKLKSFRCRILTALRHQRVVTEEDDPKLPSRDCQSHNRIYMDGSAVDERERGVLLTEGQDEIGPAKHDCLGALCAKRVVIECAFRLIEFDI